MTRRRVFTLASLLSLLLCMAAVVVWVRGLTVVDMCGIEWCKLPPQNPMYIGFTKDGPVDLHEVYVFSEHGWELAITIGGPRISRPAIWTALHGNTPTAGRLFP